MKKILASLTLLSAALTLLPFPASADSIGFRCNGVEIVRVETATEDRIEIRHESGEVERATGWELPSGDTVDAYQTRVGTYLTWMELAHERFPYAPEFITVFRMMSSASKYRAGFRALENQGKPALLGKIACRALTDAILRRN